MPPGSCLRYELPFAAALDGARRSPEEATPGSFALAAGRPMVCAASLRSLSSNAEAEQAACRRRAIPDEADEACAARPAPGRPIPTALLQRGEPALKAPHRPSLPRRPAAATGPSALFQPPARPLAHKDGGSTRPARRRFQRFVIGERRRSRAMERPPSACRSCRTLRCRFRRAFRARLPPSRECPGRTALRRRRPAPPGRPSQGAGAGNDQHGDGDGKRMLPARARDHPAVKDAAAPACAPSACK